MHATHKAGALSARDPKFIATDARVVRWIAQAAVNVELFTIPLYMTALYSIQGMHPITGSASDFYTGRQWPGAKTSALADGAAPNPGWANRQAFNIVFSVFIQEMLHLQMAANLATAIGHEPSFTDKALQDAEHGWTCFGPALTILPGILDLTDTDTYSNVKVDIGPLDSDRIDLFLAIEQPQDDAERDIVRNRDRYFPNVPFDGGAAGFDPAAAGIMFGSIGYMYQCYRDYLKIDYADGSRLWDHVFDPDGQQNDLFNAFSFPGHPMREFMGFESTVALTDRDIAFGQALDMMNAITDQGEGATLKARMLRGNALAVLGDVEKRYCPDEDALKSDYPSFSDRGVQLPSADAAARADNDGQDHYSRFSEVRRLMAEGGILTWDKAGKAGNWTAADLVTPDYDPKDNPYGLPTPEEVAAALNNLYLPDVRAANFLTLSQAVVGAIKGVTTVLDQYWNPADGTAISFPFPSMVGSGDRMSACWAVFGRTPDLSQGIADPDTKIVNHACQGLSFDSPSGAPGVNHCAETSVYHSCRGSNLCKGMGGCGFVQASTGGGSGCSAVRMRVQGGLCGGPKPPAPKPGGTPTYTAPSDNICGGFGGCAVPISAAQVYPREGVMDVYQLSAAHGCGQFPATRIGTIDFKIGDKVEDIAFQAFTMVADKMGYKPPVQQTPNDLRLAFPPST
jgi:hypothetical protein